MNIGLPTDLNWYKLLTDWGSIIGGVFALIAGVFAYIAGMMQAKATQRAADAQIAVNARKDRLQAHCIAVGIYPELLAVKVSHERAAAIIAVEFPKKIALTRQIVDVIRSAAIEEPPLIRRSLDNIYVLEEAGATILQLFSVILQYNSLIGTIAKQTAEDVNSFDALTSATNLSGHLLVMSRLLGEAEQKIEPIHNATIR